MPSTPRRTASRLLATSSSELDFVTQGPYSRNVGSRTYSMHSDSTYKLLNLKNKEFTYTVDDSNLGCGLNGVLYFVAVIADGGNTAMRTASMT